MTCNAWNHPPDCNCGWGGQFYEPGALTDHFWPLRDGGTLVPNTKCPKCGANVFFYRAQNGGCAYFDELGSPWPKHPCMDSGGVTPFPASARWEAAELLAPLVKRIPLNVLSGTQRAFFEGVENLLGHEIEGGRMKLVAAYWVACLPPAALGVKDVDFNALRVRTAYPLALNVLRFLGDGPLRGNRVVCKGLAIRVIKRREAKQTNLPDQEKAVMGGEVDFTAPKKPQRL